VTAVPIPTGPDDKQAETDAYYEKLASQEQIYLDEVEARLIESLTTTETSPE
jgi:hypothetical protein